MTATSATTDPLPAQPASGAKSIPNSAARRRIVTLEIPLDQRDIHLTASVGISMADGSHPA
jgi:hypothetical protein